MSTLKEARINCTELAEKRTIGVKITGENNQQTRLFAVIHNDEYYVYLNECPHMGVSLEWTANQFLDFENKYIQCSMHGALFNIDDGYCVRGPCVGQRLRPLDFEVVNGELLVQLIEQQSC